MPPRLDAGGHPRMAPKYVTGSEGLVLRFRPGNAESTVDARWIQRSRPDEAGWGQTFLA